MSTGSGVAPTLPPPEEETNVMVPTLSWKTADKILARRRNQKKMEVRFSEKIYKSDARKQSYLQRK